MAIDINSVTGETVVVVGRLRVRLLL